MDFIFDETAEEMSYFWKKPVPSYVPPQAEIGSFWGQLVRYDIALIWKIRKLFDSIGVGYLLKQFISNNPYRDISLITWAATIIGWWEFGIKMVWITILNLFFVFFLRAMIQAPRPFEFDRNLRPMADRQQSSYGCPSIESFMSVITFGYLSYRIGNGNILYHFIAFFISFFIGMTRIYAGSRFIHQIIISWLFGCNLLWLYINKIQIYIPDWGEDVKNKKMRLALMIPWAFAFLAYICLALEDNSSTLFRIPNSEFIRVMTHIIDTGAASDESNDRNKKKKKKKKKGTGRRGDNDDDDDDDDDDEDDDDDPLMRRYRDQNASKEEMRRRQQAKKKDSFYFLQHSIRSKDIERIQLRNLGQHMNDDNNDGDFHDMHTE
mmetsp:Transcript_594/g.760  ORF Transcript_594/g.760 Transcript_594/m.760 type:complete len:378 (+) Transcript_594:67-1200(+)